MASRDFLSIKDLHSLTLDIKLNALRDTAGVTMQYPSPECREGNVPGPSQCSDCQVLLGLPHP